MAGTGGGNHADDLPAQFARHGLEFPDTNIGWRSVVHSLPRH
jgi:hypothetical protein